MNNDLQPIIIDKKDSNYITFDEFNVQTSNNLTSYKDGVVSSNIYTLEEFPNDLSTINSYNFLTENKLQKYLSKGNALSVNGNYYCVVTKDNKIVNGLKIVELNEVSSINNIYSIDTPAYFVLKQSVLNSYVVNGKYDSYSYLVCGTRDDVDNFYFKEKQTNNYTYKSVNTFNGVDISNRYMSYVINTYTTTYTYNIIQNNSFVILQNAYERVFVNNSSNINGYTLIADNYKKIIDESSEYYEQVGNQETSSYEINTYNINYNFEKLYSNNVLNYESLVYSYILNNDGDYFVDININNDTYRYLLKHPLFDRGSLNEYIIEYYDKINNIPNINQHLYIRSNYKKVDLETAKQCFNNGESVFTRELIAVSSENYTLDDINTNDNNILYVSSIENISRYLNDEDTLLCVFDKFSLENKINTQKEFASAQIINLENSDIVSVIRSQDEYKASKITKYFVDIRGTFSKITTQPNLNSDKEYYILEESYLDIGTYKPVTFYISDEDNNKTPYIQNVLQLSAKINNTTSSITFFLFFNWDTQKQFINCPINYYVGSLVDVDINLYNKYFNEIENGEIKLYKKINIGGIETLFTSSSYGILSKDGVCLQYYKGTPQYVLTSDTITCQNKQYFYKTKHDGIKKYNYIPYDSSKLFDSTGKKYDNVVSYTLFKQTLFTHNIESLKTPFDASLIHTKYIYPNHIVHNGIGINGSGSYTITAEIFSKTSGKTSKTFTLNINNVLQTAYVYKNVLTKYTRATVVLEDPSLYYVFDNGEYVNLSYIYKTVEQAQKVVGKNGIYEKESITHNIIFNGSSNQYSEGNKKKAYGYSYLTTPKIFSISNKFYGLILDDDNTSFDDTLYSDLNYANVGRFTIKQLYKNYQLGPNKSKDLFGINCEEAMNNYNSITNYISKPTPIFLANDITYTLNGSYTWHKSKNAACAYNKLIYNTTYTLGYWSQNYDSKINQFEVSAYIHNTSDGASLSYNFIPNSYVVSATIKYPKISYNTIKKYSTLNDIYYIHFHNTVREIEYSNVLTYNNKLITYLGEKQYDVYKTQKLTEGRTIVENVLQDNHTDEIKFAYKTSIELTNEKVPVLKETVIHPANIQKVNIYDNKLGVFKQEDVVISYAYYAYEYMLETKPLIVSSYISQTEQLNICYLEDINNTLVEVNNSIRALSGLSPITIQSVVEKKKENTITQTYTNVQSDTQTTYNKGNNISNLAYTNSQITQTYISTEKLENLLTKLTYSNTNGFKQITETIASAANNTVTILSAVASAISENSTQGLENITPVSVNNISSENISYNNVSNTSVESSQTSESNQATNTNTNNTITNTTSSGTETESSEYEEDGQSVLYTPATLLSVPIGLNYLKRENSNRLLNINKTLKGRIANELSDISKISNHITKLEETINNTSYQTVNVINDAFVPHIQHLDKTIINIKNNKVRSAENTYTGEITNFPNMIDNLFNHVSMQKKDIVQKDGSINTELQFTYTGIADILYGMAGGKNGIYGIPSKEKFIIELSSKMYTNYDFDTEIVDSVEYDDKGNETGRKTHKNNPYECAKKAVTRSNILWEELAKQGYVEDTKVDKKQQVIANKTAALKAAATLKATLKK